MENLTVQQLIDLLNKVEDKNKTVEIAVHQFNKAYPVAYTVPSNRDYLRQTDCSVRIGTWLPDNMRTSVRKEK